MVLKWTLIREAAAVIHGQRPSTLKYTLPALPGLKSMARETDEYTEKAFQCAADALNMTPQRYADYIGRPARSSVIAV